MNDIINSKLPAALRIACAKGVTPDLWATILDPFMWQWGIRTPRKVAAFIGQVSVESAGFSVLEENLNYSAGRMMQVWPSRFAGQPTPWESEHLNAVDTAEICEHRSAAAEACAHNPEALANFVYANRMGNGPVESGDGWTFRGAGLIQLTGRENQSKFAAYAKMVPGEVGAYLRTPKGAAESACWAWSQLFDCNPAAEGWFITSITRKINGGSEGLQQRLDMSNAILRKIG